MSLTHHCPILLFSIYLCVFVNKSYFVFFSGQKVTSRRKSTPRTKDESGPNTNADPPMDVSRDYILFSPTRLAAAMKKAKLQQSLQNQSASVLTVPSGVDFSTLSDTVPQTGVVICNVFLCVTLVICLNFYLGICQIYI